MSYPEPRLQADETLVALPTLNNVGLPLEGASSNREWEQITQQRLITLCDKSKPALSPVRLPNYIEIL